MTQRFILDENVIILAQRGENDQGETDLTCLQLIQQIIKICHTIVYDPTLRNKTFRQLSRVGRSKPQIGPLLIRVLMQAEHRVGKVENTFGISLAFPEESTIPPGSTDDTEIVRLAVETGATLVTTDQPLRDDLESTRIAETYDFEVLSPREALDRL